MLSYSRVMSQKHPIRHHGVDPAAQMCGSKRRYLTKQQAELVREQQELLNNELELKVYRCHAGCKGWHLTRNKTD